MVFCGAGETAATAAAVGVASASSREWPPFCKKAFANCIFSPGSGLAGSESASETRAAFGASLEKEDEESGAIAVMVRKEGAEVEI
jgi:hypothetical protein